MKENNISPSDDLKNKLYILKNNIENNISGFGVINQNSEKINLAYTISLRFGVIRQPITLDLTNNIKYTPTKTSLFYIVNIYDKFVSGNVIQRNLGYMIFDIYKQKMKFVYNKSTEDDKIAKLKLNVDLDKDIKFIKTQLEFFHETFLKKNDKLKKLKGFINLYIKTLIDLSKLKDTVKQVEDVKEVKQVEDVKEVKQVEDVKEIETSKSVDVLEEMKKHLNKELDNVPKFDVNHMNDLINFGKFKEEKIIVVVIDTKKLDYLSIKIEQHINEVLSKHYNVGYKLINVIVLNNSIYHYLSK